LPEAFWQNTRRSSTGLNATQEWNRREKVANSNLQRLFQKIARSKVNSGSISANI